MKVTIDFKYFEAQFKKIRPLNFSQEGLEALYNYLIGYEDVEYEYECSTGKKIDIAAICCEFVEYKSIAEFNADRGTHFRNRDEACELGEFILSINDKAFIFRNFYI